MGLSCFRAISGLGMGMGMDGMGWDLCAGLFYEHRFAMLIMIKIIFCVGHSAGPSAEVAKDEVNQI